MADTQIYLSSQLMEYLMTILTTTTKKEIDDLLKQYKTLLDEAENIKLINKDLNQSYQKFCQACCTYYNNLEKLDGINEKEGLRRKKGLEQALPFLQKMNSVASQYETISDIKELIISLDDIFMHEVRRLPEKIAYYALTCLLSFAYIASMILVATIITAAFTTPLTAVIVGLTVGTALGVLIALKDAKPTAYNKTYNFFRSFDPEPVEKAVDFMYAARCIWAHRFEEDYSKHAGHITRSAMS